LTVEVIRGSAIDPPLLLVVVNIIRIAAWLGLLEDPRTTF
jgi:hypothetical protein